MPQLTAIEWADYSTNPLKLKLHKTGKLVNACIKVSEGCRGCYAESITRHWFPKAEGGFPGYSLPLMDRGTIVLDEREMEAIRKFKPKGPFKNDRSRPLVFPFDMTDLFGDWVPTALIDQAFAVMATKPDVDFMILTKRPKRMAEYMPRGYDVENDTLKTIGVWPLSNVWLGTSIEDQKAADARLPWLAKINAAHTFISQEPQIGPIRYPTDLRIADLIIVGGESGPKARPFNIDWARTTQHYCHHAGIAFFMKQLGAKPFFTTMPDQYEIKLKLADRHGGTMEQWPDGLADLRERVIPK